MSQKKVGLPLCHKTFYIDEDGILKKKLAQLEQHLVILGAKVEKFFTKEISFLISAHGSPEDYNRDVTSTTESAGTPSPFANTPGQSTPPAYIDKGAALAGRGAMMLRRSSVKPTNVVISNSQKLIHSAKLWKIRLLEPNAALQWLEKKITKLDLVLEKPKMPKESKRIKTVKERALKGKFIKVEDNSRSFRFTSRSFEPEELPILSLTTVHMGCPFEHHPPHASGQETRMVATKLGLTKNAVYKSPEKDPADFEDKRKKLTFCMVCKTRYSDLNQHLRSDQHREFATDDSNYVRIDEIISQTSSLQNFLSDVREYRQTYQTELLTCGNDSSLLESGYGTVAAEHDMAIRLESVLGSELFGTSPDEENIPPIRSTPNIALPRTPRKVRANSLSPRVICETKPSLQDLTAKVDLTAHFNEVLSVTRPQILAQPISGDLVMPDQEEKNVTKVMTVQMSEPALISDTNYSHSCGTLVDRTVDLSMEDDVVPQSQREQGITENLQAMSDESHLLKDFVPENLIDAHERIIDTESFHADHPVDGTQAVETVCSVEPGIALGVTRESVSLGCPPPESITDSTPIDTAKISMKVSKSPSATRRSAEQRLVDDLSFKTSIDISPSESVKLRKRGNKTHSLPTSKELLQTDSWEQALVPRKSRDRTSKSRTRDTLSHIPTDPLLQPIFNSQSANFNDGLACKAQQTKKARKSLEEERLDHHWESASSGKNDDILVQEILKGVANANTDSDEGDDEAALSQCDSYISLKINSLTTQPKSIGQQLSHKYSPQSLTTRDSPGEGFSIHNPTTSQLTRPKSFSKLDFGHLDTMSSSDKPEYMQADDHIFNGTLNQTTHGLSTDATENASITQSNQFCSDYDKSTQSPSTELNEHESSNETADQPLHQSTPAAQGPKVIYSVIRSTPTTVSIRKSLFTPKDQCLNTIADQSESFNCSTVSVSSCITSPKETKSKGHTKLNRGVTFKKHRSTPSHLNGSLDKSIDRSIDRLEYFGFDEEFPEVVSLKAPPKLEDLEPKKVPTLKLVRTGRTYSRKERKTASRSPKEKLKVLESTGDNKDYNSQATSDAENIKPDWSNGRVPLDVLPKETRKLTSRNVKSIADRNDSSAVADMQLLASPDSMCHPSKCRRQTSTISQNTSKTRALKRQRRDSRASKRPRIDLSVGFTTPRPARDLHIHKLQQSVDLTIGGVNSSSPDERYFPVDRVYSPLPQHVPTTPSSARDFIIRKRYGHSPPKLTPS